MTSKGCESENKIQDSLHTIYGGDTKILRAKSQSIRGKFEDMKMQEGENVAQYCSRIKDVAKL